MTIKAIQLKTTQIYIKLQLSAVKFRKSSTKAITKRAALLLSKEIKWQQETENSELMLYGQEIVACCSLRYYYNGQLEVTGRSNEKRLY